MAESARRREAPLIPERASSCIYPTVDDDLLIRIRSLLDARNSLRPPRTPHSSVQHSFIARSADLEHRSTASRRKRRHRFKPEEAIAKLAQLEVELANASGMAINRFDGPAGQIEQDEVDGPRRQPSQPNLDSEPRDRGKGRSVQQMTGLNTRSSVSGPSFGGGNTSLARTPSFKRKPDTPKSLQKASAVPPTYPWLKEKRLRPQVQHVPGSFGSTIDPLAEQSLGLALPALNEVSVISPVSAETAHPHEPHYVSSTTAMESLLHAKDSDAVSLRGKRSQASLKSIASARTLMKPHADPSHLNQVVQPILTREVELVQSDQEVFDTVTQSSDASVPSQSRYDGQTRSEADGNTKQSQPLGSINGTPISQLLAELPPIKQTTIDDLNAVPITSEARSDPSGLGLRRQSIREHSRELSSHDEPAGLEFSHRPDLPLKNTSSTDRVPQKRKSSQALSTQSRSSPSTPLSNASRKAASLTRAIAALSQFSSKSSLQILPLRSSTNYERIGSADDGRPPANTGYGASGGPRSGWVHNLLSTVFSQLLIPLPHLLPSIGHVT